MNTLRKILKPLASLRLTVILLALSMVLVLAGTLGQRYDDTWTAQRHFFYSGWCYINGRDFLPKAHTGEPGLYTWLRSVHLPMLGGYTLGLLLLLNLLAAHTVRFKFTWKRSGIILIHLGLIVLFVSQGVYSVQTEGVMTIREGKLSNYSEAPHSSEFAITDPAAKGHDDVTIAGNALTKGAEFTDPRLPFTVKVEEYWVNSLVLGPQQGDPSPHPAVTAGEGMTKHVMREDSVSGTSGDGENQPAAFVTLVAKDGKTLGTYLVSTSVQQMQAGEDDITDFKIEDQDVTVNGKTYQIALRHTRYYKPYWIYLEKFHHNNYSGTDTPENYSSDIRLVDPSANTDRPVTISMNHPLRYNFAHEGESTNALVRAAHWFWHEFIGDGYDTLYQASFAGSHVTGLQVVRNPGWRLPYWAIAISAIGLLVHFGMNLVNFLRKNAKVAAAKGEYPILAPFGVAAAMLEMTLRTPGEKRGAKAASSEGYVLHPANRWTSPAVWFPALIAASCVALIAYLAAPAPKQPASFDYEAFGRVPVMFEGRVQPLDSLARNSLRLMSNRDTLKVEGGQIPASQWLLELMSLKDDALDRPVFRVDFPDLVSLLGGAEDKQLFSINDIMGDTDRRKKFFEQIDRLFNANPEELDQFQSHLRDLYAKLVLFQKLRFQTAFELPQRKGVPTRFLQEELNATVKAFGENRAVPVPEAIPAEMVPRFLQEMADTVKKDWGNRSLQLAAPDRPDGDWLRLSEVIADTYRAAADDKPAPDVAQARSLRSFLKIIADYQENRPSAFNHDLADYQKALDHDLPADMRTVGVESLYNRVAPFITGMWLFLGGFVLISLSWLFWQKPLFRGAVAVVAVTLILETVAITARIYITGKPAVTNLYTVATFIAWGGVTLCLGLTWVFRKSKPALADVSITAASLVGVLSLGLAYFIHVNRLGGSSETGDTMPKLQAVLNTSFWLATHVQCITLGYASTYLAGFLGILFVVKGLFTTSLDKETGRDFARMIYGIVCFSLLFSFVGTLLGGIWADQSWGRFWGWDAKENGAALLVAWNAIILHARWGGLVRDRGLALLAIFGNVVTSWSGLGVNMLDIGLHKYAKMSEYAPHLIILCLSMMAIILIGSLPLRLWRSPMVGKGKE